VKAIKSDSDSDSAAMSKKRSPGFSGKNRGVTPSVAAPGVTHPSDATGYFRTNLDEIYTEHPHGTSYKFYGRILASYYAMLVRSQLFSGFFLRNQFTK